MFRTLAASRQPDVAPRTAAPQPTSARPTYLRLQWSVNDGRPMARWRREPHDRAEDVRRRLGRVAA